jgi:hypothetical protein
MKNDFGKFEIDPNSRFVIVGRKLKRLKMRIVKRRSNNINRNIIIYDAWVERN